MVVILNNIRSVYNVGSIFRTADALGVEKIYLCGITPISLDRFGRVRKDFAKVSLGAEKSVKWEYFKFTSLLVSKLKKQKYKIFAVEQASKSTSYHKINCGKSDFPHIGLVLGNEINGIAPNILKKCDKILEIPMRGKKESLNVAVAFGIVGYHLVFRK